MPLKEHACELFLASMRKFYREHLRANGITADNLKRKIANRQALLAAAEPVGSLQHLRRARVLIGAEIRNSKDEKIGTIEDVVFDPKGQTIRYVAATPLGSQTADENWVAVRWSDLRATEDHELYLLNIGPLRKLHHCSVAPLRKAQPRMAPPPRWLLGCHSQAITLIRPLKSIRRKAQSAHRSGQDEPL